jgi:tRNA pseudouridine13 synthase
LGDEPSAPLPFLTGDLAGLGGRIKQEPEDFLVEEIPAYTPAGQGEYHYLWVEKRDLGAEFFLRLAARKLGVPAAELGTAGLKDRRAVTRQWLSVPAALEPNLAALDGDGITVLAASRHGNKLRPGHLQGNRFRIRIRDVDPAAAGRLPALLDRLRQVGLANFYGPQRFGRGGETLALGMQLLRGEPAKRVGRFLLKLALSAAQSALFNACLARRLADGLLRTVLAGDVLAKWPHGGMFTAADVAAEQARFDRRETVITGPMFGKKMYPAAADVAAAREAAVLEAAGLTPQAFAGHGKMLGGARRKYLVYLDDLAGAVEGPDVVLTFTLPAGSYATVLLREVMKADAADPDAADEVED